MTAYFLISRAMRLIGSLAQNEVPNAAEAADALATLNEMVDAWGTERLTIFTTTRTQYPLTVNVQDYTIGATGTFVQARPVWLENVSVVQDPSGDQPIELPLLSLTDDQWAGVTTKSVTAALPVEYYYNPTYPNGTISLWPIPSVTDLELAVYTPTALTQFAALQTDYTFPPGYQKALRFNLAVVLAVEYGRPVDPALRQEADDSKGDIKRANIRMSDLMVDSALLQRSNLFNYITGEML